VDEQLRVRIPDAKPGQVLDYTVNPDGSFKLTPVVKTEPETVTVGLVRKDGELVLNIPKNWTLVEESIVQSIDAVRRGESSKES
jgi:hypothetical protein